VAVHPDLFRASAAECHAAAQAAQDSTVRQTYLELMQAWRHLAEEADRLMRPSAPFDPLIAFRVRASAPPERFSKRILPPELEAPRRKLRAQSLRR
jgi:hypothetical protein